MTITVDFPQNIAEKIQADAKTQNRPVEKVVQDAVADWYDGENSENGEILYPEDADLALPPLPASLRQSLAEDMQEARADIEAGRVIDGETFLAELRRRAGRK